MDKDSPSDEEIERGAERYYKWVRKNSIRLGSFTTLYDLLHSNSPVSIAALATAIERHGVSGWDRFGRYRENDETIKKKALDALGDYVDWLREEHRKNEWPNFPSFEVSDYPLSDELSAFAWKTDALPNLEEIGASIETMPEPPRRQSDTTRRTDTLLVLIAALAKEANIDVSARGAAQRIKSATERLGIPVSADTIKRFIDAIPDTLEKREKSV